MLLNLVKNWLINIMYKAAFMIERVIFIGAAFRVI